MTERRSYRQVMSRDLPTLLKAGGTLIDIRRPEEWRLTGLVAGSLTLTFFDQQGDCNPQEWIRDMEQMAPEGQPLILICRTGHRTALICEMLIEMTSRDIIYNVTDGIFGWLGEELPVVPFDQILL